ncbi:MAG: hypothetical protein HY554_04715 [Elusimicrobia bacterium]|nr:hypothetical protein [Elusimicrobiota bacterium]
MPQKRNPDVVELTRARAALFPGWLLQTLSVGARSSGYHRDYQMTKGPVFAAVRAALEMLEMVERLPRSISINRALELVKQGVPFRDAYRRVAAEARSAAADWSREGRRRLAAAWKRLLEP